MSIFYLGPWLRDNTYAGKQKLCLLAIANAVGEDGCGFISHDGIREVASADQTYITESVRKFCDDGVLEILEPPKRGRATVYRLTLPPSYGRQGRMLRTDGKDGCLEDKSLPIGGQSPTHSPQSPTHSGQSPTQLVPVKNEAALGRGNAGEGFDTFWDAYPLKTAKAEARRAWEKVPAADRDAAIAGAATYAAWLRQHPDPPKTKYAQGWLNGRRWEDELPTPRPTTAASVRNAEREALLRKFQAEENGLREVTG